MLLRRVLLLMGFLRVSCVLLLGCLGGLWGGFGVSGFVGTGVVMRSIMMKGGCEGDSRWVGEDGVVLLFRLLDLPSFDLRILLEDATLPASRSCHSLCASVSGCICPTA